VEKVAAQGPVLYTGVARCKPVFTVELSQRCVSGTERDYVRQGVLATLRLAPRLLRKANLRNS
jgi:hypothetical protein